VATPFELDKPDETITAFHPSPDHDVEGIQPGVLPGPAVARRNQGTGRRSHTLFRHWTDRQGAGLRLSAGPDPDGCCQKKRLPKEAPSNRSRSAFQSFMPLSAGCTISPPSTLRPLTRIASLRQLFCASRVTYGRIAAEIACEEVCGTAPGMLVTQKCVTPSTT